MISSTHHNDVISTHKAYKKCYYEAIFLHSTMKSITSAQQDQIISLLTSGHSTRAVAFLTGVRKSKVANLAKEMLPNKENLQGGHLSKLSPTNRQAIIIQIQTGKAENAVQVSKNMNTILPHSISAQTVRNVLKKDDFIAVVKKKKPFSSK